MPLVVRQNIYNYARPMINHYPHYITEAVPADIVIETITGTFVGRFDRKRLDRSTAALPVEQQPIWSIRFIETTTDNSKNAITRTLYPDGNTDYDYKWTDRELLTYQYAR